MNRKLEKLIVFAGVILVLSGTGCFRKNVLTVTVNVPQMKAAECSKLIQDALLKIDGIMFAQPDTTTHSIAVTYDSRKLALKNIEFLISGAGFAANDTPANPEARAALPEACR